MKMPMPQRNRGMSCLLLSLIGGALVFCFVSGVVTIWVNPLAQSKWLATKDGEIEVGPHEALTLPYEALTLIPLPTPLPSLNSTNRSHPLEAMITRPDMARVKCRYYGSPMVDIAGVSIRLWDCK